MTGSFTNWAEAKILDHIFGGIAWSVPTLHIGYTQTASGESGAGSEPVGAGYQRVAVPPSVWSTSSSASITNTAEIVCPRATGNQGSVTGLILTDSSVGGNVITYIPLTSPVIIENRDALIIPAGTIAHSFGTGGFTTYLKNLILNHVYKSMPMGIDPILYAGYMSSTPTDSVQGTEPSAGGYSRVSLNNNTTTFANTSLVKTNSIQIDFLEAIASQGTITHFGLWNAVSGGQLLGYAALSPQKTIASGDSLAIPIASLNISID